MIYYVNEFKNQSLVNLAETARRDITETTAEDVVNVLEQFRNQKIDIAFLTMRGSSVKVEIENPVLKFTGYKPEYAIYGQGAKSKIEFSENEVNNFDLNGGKVLRMVMNSCIMIQLNKR